MSKYVNEFVEICEIQNKSLDQIKYNVSDKYAELFNGLIYGRFN